MMGLELLDSSGDKINFCMAAADTSLADEVWSRTEMRIVIYFRTDGVWSYVNKRQKKTRTNFERTKREGE